MRPAIRVVEGDIAAERIDQRPRRVARGAAGIVIPDKPEDAGPVGHTDIAGKFQLAGRHVIGCRNPGIAEIRIGHIASACGRDIAGCADEQLVIRVVVGTDRDPCARDIAADREIGGGNRIIDDAALLIVDVQREGLGVGQPVTAGVVVGDGHIDRIGPRRNIGDVGPGRQLHRSGGAEFKPVVGDRVATRAGNRQRV